MHFAIVEDLKIDQNHLIHLIQENLEKHGETACFDCYESGESFSPHRNVIIRCRGTVSIRLIIS